MARRVKVFSTVAPIGVVSSASLSTFAEGEDAFEWREPAPMQVRQSLVEHQTAARLWFTIELVATTPSGAELRVPHGMDIWLERDDLLDPASHGPLELTITLNTDLYASRSWGEDRDNHALAAANAPAFNAFLAAFAKELDSSIDEVDVGDYEGVVTTAGFAV